MREMLILAPGANPSELLKSMARFGKNTFNYRVLNAAGLAEFALQRSGIAVTERPVTVQEAASLIADLLPQCGEYWENSGFADAEQLASTLQTARLQITEDERNTLEAALGQSEFTEKNEALLCVYDAYLARLSEAAEPLTDTVLLLRRAIAETEPLQNAEIILLEEYPCAPLELALAEHLAGQTLTPVSLRMLYEKEAQPLRVETYTAAYGASNEIADILRTIRDEQLPLDECLIAVSDPRKYAQLLLDLCRSLHIPVSFGCGVPVSNTLPSAFLKAYAHWSGPGFFGTDALNALIFGTFFSSSGLREKVLGELFSAEEEVPRKAKRRKVFAGLVALAGNLRLSDNADDNARKLDALQAAWAAENAEYADLDCTKKLRAELGGAEQIIVCLRRLSCELALPPADFLQNYAQIRFDDDAARQLDLAARGTLCRSIREASAFSGHIDIGARLPKLLGKTVSAAASEPGSLYVTDLSHSAGALRKNLFVAGLSADLFPGKPTENFLLLDSELESICDAQAPTSVQLILRKREQLLQTLQLAAALGCRIRLSYSEFDPAELKTVNFSSALFELFRMEHGEHARVENLENVLRKAGYFEQDLFADETVGREYLRGDTELTFLAPECTQQTAVKEPSAAFPPTAVETFCACPKKFMLERLAGISQQEEDNPLEVLSAAASGTAVHSMMQYYSEHPELSAEEFHTLCEQQLDTVLLQRIPINPTETEKFRSDYLKMMDAAYQTARSPRGLPPETNLTAEHPSGVKLQGIPDRLEENPDGTYRVVDYKTKRKPGHTENDVRSCIQVMLYAYMAEKNGIDITGGEYRYVRLRQNISCSYNEETKAQLAEILTDLKSAIKHGEFPAKLSDSCQYCSFGAFCGLEN